MNKVSTILAGIAAIATALSFASCSREAPFVGRWKSVKTVDITSQISDASNASSLVTIDFIDNLQKEGGNVTLSSAVSVSRQPNPVGFQLKAVATVDGTWTYDVDDQDDLLLNLNLADMKLDINPADVTLTGTGDATPEQMDSIKSVIIDNCRHEIVRALSSDLSRYTTISDIEVKKGNRLEFEVNSPDEDLHFIKEGV